MTVHMLLMGHCEPRHRRTDNLMYAHLIWALKLAAVRRTMQIKA